MNENWPFAVSRWLVAGLLVGVLSEPLPAQEADARIAQVVADWLKRQERTQRVRYEVSGQATVPKGSRTPPQGLASPEESGENPPRDITSPIKEIMLIDFASGRYRIYLERQTYDKGTDRLYPVVNTRVFDGKELKGWSPRHLNTHPVIGVKPGEPEIGIAKGNLSGAAFTVGERPFFAGHGSIAWTEGQIMPGKLRTMPDTELLTVHGQGVHNGRACLVLRTPTRRGHSTSFDEYWVDTQRESALARQLHYVGNVAQYEISIEYQPTAQGWLPKRWTVTERTIAKTASGKPSYLSSINVDRLELEPSIQSSDFEIEEQPGMIVDVRNYSSSKPGVPLAEETETTVFMIDSEGQRQMVSTNLSPGRYRWWYLTGGILAALLLVGAWWRRHRRKVETV